MLIYCAFPYFSGQAKVIMNPALHKQQFDRLLKEVDPVEAEMKRYTRCHVDDFSTNSFNWFSKMIPHIKFSQMTIFFSCMF